MAMFFVVPVLASISGVVGQYVCTAPTTNLAATTTCDGTRHESCRENDCCTTPIRCEDTPDTKKQTRCGADKIFNSVQSNYQSDIATAGDAYYVTNCCVACAAATCKDWAEHSSLSCGTGKSGKKTNPSLPATSACVAPTADIFTSTCCSDIPIHCYGYNGTQTDKNNVCVADNKYYKPPLSVWDFDPIVMASASDADFKSTCCTSCTTITCKNLKDLMFSDLACVGTQSVRGTYGLDSTLFSPALTNCEKPTEEAFRNACCMDVCGASGTPTTRRTRCGTGKIFDEMKNYEYPADGTDPKFVTACCKDCSAAICKDWHDGNDQCDGKNGWSKSTALPGGTACAEPTAETMKATCCLPKVLCSEWINPDGDASASLPVSFPLIGTLLASVAVMLGVECV